MPDFKRLNINGNNYDVKDATARTEAGAAASDALYAKNRADDAYTLADDKLSPVDTTLPITLGAGEGKLELNNFIARLGNFLSGSSSAAALSATTTSMNSTSLTSIFSSGTTNITGETNVSIRGGSVTINGEDVMALLAAASITNTTSTMPIVDASAVALKNLIIKHISGSYGDYINLNICGINVFDEQVESGSINTNGELVTNPSRIRSKNKIYVEAGKSYYYKSATNDLLLFYKSDDTFISYAYRTNASFNTPAETAYMRIAYNGSYGTTYNNDTSVNSPASYTDYVPFSGQYVSIGLPYGGAVNAEYDYVTGKIREEGGDWQVLTPAHTVTAKYGVNNFYSNFGNAEATYTADLKLYIDNH